MDIDLIHIHYLTSFLALMAAVFWSASAKIIVPHAFETDDDFLAARKAVARRNALAAGFSAATALSLSVSMNREILNWIL